MCHTVQFRETNYLDQWTFWPHNLVKIPNQFYIFDLYIQILCLLFWFCCILFISHFKRFDWIAALKLSILALKQATANGM